MKADVLRPRQPNQKGIAAAAVVISAWSITLVLLLGAELEIRAYWALPAILLQTFFYTGLFITAHDAMHGTVAPDMPRINRAVGAICVALYALFSFQKLHDSHWEHHRHPASTEDPDFHAPNKNGLLRWYARFMGEYLSVPQLIGMAAVFNILQYAVGVPVPNLVLFWVVPALLSTWQLFYFGTVLPHREPAEGYEDHHRATSNDYRPWLSFLTCYHFGYHWEHHDRPDLPWWALPAYRRRRTESTPIKNG